MEPHLTRRIRTVLYDDQLFSATEIDLLHTPALQRLYELHQLGLTDRIFIDASHSRLHHVVGAVEQADKMMRAIIRNLRKAPDERLAYGGGGALGITKKELAIHAERKIPAVRLMALLHDLTHSPYGHTLEDEIELLKEKHDEPDRQADGYYRLALQYFAWIERNQSDKPWGVSSRDRPNEDDHVLFLDWHLDAPDIHVPPESDEFIDFFARRWSSFLRPQQKRRRTLRRIPAVNLAAFVRDLHFAMRALLHLDIAHRDKEALESGKGCAPRSEYRVDRLLCAILDNAKVLLEDTDIFDPQRDVFLLDVLANTICADLLDYARRDAVWAGIKLNYDADRIVENMSVVAHQTVGATQVRCADRQIVDFPLAGVCLMDVRVSFFSQAQNRCAWRIDEPTTGAIFRL